jgi:hypothetical protein
MRTKRESVLEFTAAYISIYGGLDNVPVTAGELCEIMCVSHRKLSDWQQEGYRFELGHRTTAGHLKEWLRSRSKC